MQETIKKAVELYTKAGVPAEYTDALLKSKTKQEIISANAHCYINTETENDYWDQAMDLMDDLIDEL